MIKKPAANAAPLFSALTVIAMFFLCRIAAAAVPGIDVNVMRPDFNTGEWTVAAPAATGTFDIARATQAASAATETAPDKAAPAQPVTTAPQPKVPMIEYEPGTAPPKAPPQAAASVEKKAQQKKSDITLSGYRYVRMRNYSSEGNQSRFQSQEGLFSRGSKLEQGSDMAVVAKTGNIGLKGKFRELPQQEREMDFQLDTGRWSASFGDLTVNFKGGEFSPFSKKITGFELGYLTKTVRAQLISSSAKSQTRTESFSGRNLKGPYDLSANDIIPESVTVRMNSIPMAAGSYILDAFIGQITFYDTIGPNDIVTVTYEQRLRGGLSAGNIMGFSTGYTADRWSLGFSHLVQQANKSAESAQKGVVDETATLDGNVIRVSNNFISRTPDKGSETIKAVTGTGETTLADGVDYNAGLPLGDRMENYRYGRFVLVSPDPTAVYKVSYSYYPESGEVMQRQHKEFLSPIGGIATLQKQTVYYGSEDVYACYDATLDSPRVKLRRGSDYEIDETQNRITLLAYQDEPYLRIDYWYYPAANVEATNYDHTAQDFTFGFSPSKNMTFGAEYAISQSDISNKPIQITNETVAVVPAQLDCDEGFAIAACKLSLSRGNVVRNSYTVYFNDKLLQSNILAQYTHYTVDTIRGVIEFKVKIPAGTVVRADYQYLPDRPAGLVTGNIWKMKSQVSLKNTAFSIAVKGADTAFTPVGSENNMETGLVNWELSHRFGSALAFSMDSRTTKTALDLEQMNSNTSSQKNYGLAWKPKSSKHGLSLDFSYNTRDTSDDRNPRVADSAEKGYEVKGGAKMPALKNADFTFGLSGKKFDDNASGGYGNDTKKSDYGLSWKPSRQLSLSSNLSNSALTSRTAGGEFTTSNAAKSIGATYIPVNLITIGIKIDRQTTSDTRPGSEPQTISQEMARLDTRPFWKVSYISIIRTRNDRPSINTPSSSSVSSNYSTSILLTSAISYTPAFNQSESSYGSSSTSRSVNNSHKISFRPPGKPYSFSYTLNNGERTSSGSSFSSAFKVSSNRYEIGYNPSPAWDFSTNIETEKNTTAGGSGVDVNTNTINIRLRNIPNKRRTRWMSFNRIARDGAQSNSRDLLEVGLDYKLTDVFRWDFSLRHSKYDDQDNSPFSYKGNIIESSLRVEF